MLLRGAARKEAVGRGGRDAKVVVAGLDMGRGLGGHGMRGGHGERGGA